MQTVNVTFRTEVTVSGEDEDLSETSPVVCIYFNLLKLTGYVRHQQV
jgi:hypothetical protein